MNAANAASSHSRPIGRGFDCGNHLREALPHVQIVAVFKRRGPPEFGYDLGKDGVGEDLAIGNHAVEIVDD